MRPSREEVAFARSVRFAAAAACVHDGVCPAARERDEALAEVERLREVLLTAQADMESAALWLEADGGEVTAVNALRLARREVLKALGDWTQGGPEEDEK